MMHRIYHFRGTEMSKFNDLDIKGQEKLMTEKEYAHSVFLRAITEIKEHFTVSEIQIILNEEIGSKDKAEF
jgi:hypothetical protein